MTYDTMLVCVFVLCVFVLCVFVLCVCYTFVFHKCQCPTSDILIENKNKIRQLVFSCAKSSVSSIINSVLVKINDFSVLYMSKNLAHSIRSTNGKITHVSVGNWRSLVKTEYSNFKITPRMHRKTGQYPISLGFKDWPPKQTDTTKCTSLVRPVQSPM